MIELSNGYRIEYQAASGALGFGPWGWPWEQPLVKLGFIKPELFTIVIKTLTRDPRPGNLRWWKPWECVQLIPGGSVNKVGLTNPGVEWWCQKVGPRIDFQKFSMVASIFGGQKELVESAQMLNQFGFVGIEVNPSCPNTGHSMQTTEAVIESVKAVKRVSRFPVMVKVSVDQKYLDIARGLEEVAEAISLNSVPWVTAFPDGRRSPLWKLEDRVGGGGGGVSGKPAQHLNWHAVRQLAIDGSLPVIAPSVMEFADLARVRQLGARAVSFGAIHLRTPWKPTVIVLRDKKEREEK